MTTISAEVILDSVSPYGPRLTTMRLRYPRFIHAEFMTHRVFSRNASSSRAIPVKRLIQDVIDDPMVPRYWGRNQPGMQAGEEWNAVVCRPTKSGGCRNATREGTWLYARDRAVEIATDFAVSGYHKQIVNRLLEPFAHINVLVTATEWDNFFELRCHTDAEPHIQDLAREMRRVMGASVPRRLEPGEWHLPFTTLDDLMQVRLKKLSDEVEEQTMLLAISAARCARVSYLTHDRQTPTLDADLALFERLVGSRPLHASPLEHQATPDKFAAGHNFGRGAWVRPEKHGNLVGWVQHRKLRE